jgi:leucyl/phenylalanyl-tRNA--protein transferase
MHASPKRKHDTDRKMQKRRKGEVVIPWLESHAPFPDTSEALTEESGAAGLLAASAELSPQRLLEAYRQGIFPWYSIGQPVLWWSTDPRMVLRTSQFKVSHSLKKSIRRTRNSMRVGGPWEIRFDSAFEQVMRECAAPRRDGPGTWISDEMIASYVALHRMGYAHSSELWFEGRLVGGAYGVCIGRMFYGESMFARVPDASKVALACLVEFLLHNGVELIDCQQVTSHLASLGAQPISRGDFMAHLLRAVDLPSIEAWHPLSDECVVQAQRI